MLCKVKAVSPSVLTLEDVKQSVSIHYSRHLCAVILQEVPTHDAAGKTIHISTCTLLHHKTFSLADLRREGDGKFEQLDRKISTKTKTNQKQSPSHSTHLLSIHCVCLPSQDSYCGGCSSLRVSLSHTQTYH